jgi:DNA gyrase subunit A
MSTEKGSLLVFALEVVDGDQVNIMTEKGSLHQIEIDDIPSQKRGKEGHSLVGLQKDDAVIEVALEYATREAVEEEAVEEEAVEEEAVEEEAGASEQMNLLD